MIQHTANKPLSELFSSENRISYNIPKYQRDYTWGRSNWESMFDDILESNGGHFMGSIICINTQLDTTLPAELELVDGQQRMTTISLLYLALYKHLVDLVEGDNDFDKQFQIRSLKNRIVHENKTIKLTPSITYDNLNDYNWIFSNFITDFRRVDKPKNVGNRRLYKAVQYFYERISEKNEEGNSKFDYSDTLEFLKKLNSASIVKIDVGNHTDAFILFETLNNRGVPLSAIDIIKNKLLGVLSKYQKPNAIDDSFERWNKILNNLTEDYIIQERFLRQFYNAFHNEQEIKVEKNPKAIKSNLINIYEKLIDRDANLLFNRLEEASIIYNKHIVYNIDEHSLDLIKALRNLENVNGADSYLFLLFLSKKFNLNDLDKIKIIHLLCNYFIRRNVTDTPPTRDMTNYFMEAISRVNKLELFDFDKIREIILEVAKPASDEYFKEKLNNNLYEENVSATRYILSSLELSENNTREGYRNFYEKDKKQFIWTIEHIFPQGENIPIYWVDMIANGDKELAEKHRINYVHKLGNLTLTGYNPQLSNNPLKDKQDKMDKEGNYIGFKNGLKLNEPVKDIPAWTDANIINRTELLVDKAMTIFKL